MNDYDLWSGITELTPINFLLGAAVLAIVGWVIGKREKHR
jgi:hypothetical protein